MDDADAIVRLCVILTPNQTRLRCNYSDDGVCYELRARDENLQGREGGEAT